MLEVLRQEPDAVGLTLNRAMFDRTLSTELHAEPAAFLPADPETRRTWRDGRAALSELGVMQTYLTSQVVRRSAWAAALAEDPEAPYRATQWHPHTYVIARMLLAGGGAWVWEPAKLVIARTDNQASEEVGTPLDAALLAAMDIEQLWRGLFGARDPVYRRLLARGAGVWECRPGSRGSGPGPATRCARTCSCSSASPPRSGAFPPSGGTSSRG